MKATEVKINSLEELALYASKSENVITMSPGVYNLTDYLPADLMVERHGQKLFQFIAFSGNNNVFNLEGVEIVVDTDLRNALRPPIHTSEFLISGSGNTLGGLEVRYFGNGTSPGGGPGVIRHHKHSGLLVTGSNARLIECKLYMQSFGHGFYVQKNAENIYFEDCYVEGAVRKTDDILKETSGPAFDVNFRTWTINREGEYRVTPGYMKSLCEDGFRTYGQIKNIHFKNCTAKNTRGGFELRTNGGICLEDCTVIGTERGYWVGDGATMTNCKGDASCGPLFFIEGKNVDAEIIVVPTDFDCTVHGLGTIQETNNHVVLKSEEGIQRTKDIPILIGYTPPERGESMSPFGESETSRLKLRNETGMPLLIGEQVSNCEIETNGSVLENNRVFNNGDRGIYARDGATGRCVDNNSYGNQGDYKLSDAVLQSGNVSDSSVVGNNSKP